MPYVERDEQGAIKGVYANLQPGYAEEQVDDQDAGVLAFLAKAYVPPIISDRQFFQGLAIAGMISEDEAEDAVGPGIIPPPMMALIDQLPEEDRFAARMKLRGATQFLRHDALTETVRDLYGWTSEQTDQFWHDCAAL